MRHIRRNSNAVNTTEPLQRTPRQRCAAERDYTRYARHTLCDNKHSLRRARASRTQHTASPIAFCKNMWCFARRLLCAFSAQTAQRAKAKPIGCRPGVNASVQHNIRYAKCAGRYASNPRALRTTHVMSGAPGLLFSRCAVCLCRGNALPLHPVLCGRGYAATAFNLIPWPALHIAFARLQPCGLTLRARCAAHPSGPQGPPFKPTPNARR